MKTIHEVEIEDVCCIDCEYDEDLVIRNDEHYCERCWATHVENECLCWECGSKLVLIKQRHPYGDYYAVEEIFECPNC
jgi:hypothetical protein